jgi:hypothetical protein
MRIDRRASGARANHKVKRGIGHYHSVHGLKELSRERADAKR